MTLWESHEQLARISDAGWRRLFILLKEVYLARTFILFSGVDTGKILRRPANELLYTMRWYLGRATSRRICSLRKLTSLSLTNNDYFILFITMRRIDIYWHGHTLIFGIYDFARA